MALPASGAPADPRASSSVVQWWVAGLGLAILIAIYFSESLAHLAHRWSNEADYSHGFLVPPFAAYLLWFRRDMAKAGDGGRWLGVILLIGSSVLRLAAGYYGFMTADAAGLLLCLAGAALTLGGWSMLRWSWPAIVFLAFMVPLPGVLAERLAGPLQHIATLCATYLLQTLGVPAAAVGNVIHLSQDPPIMVVEACSGLRMLMCFMAIAIGAAFTVNWGIVERLIIVLSGIPIAIAVNVMRITSTGFVQEHSNAETAHAIFHDFAGWMMMPAACVLIAIELWLLNRIFPADALSPLAAARSTIRPAIDMRRGQNRSVVSSAGNDQPGGLG